jgi:predicted SprT family Zn-dependent metalloprotease
MEAQDAQRLAIYLMAKHGLTDKGWKFRFNKRLTTAGKAIEKRTGEKWIELSIMFVEINSEESVKNTILHEIGHALRGIKYGHDLQWKLVVRSIGGDGSTYCNSSTIQPSGIGRWLCTACGISKEIHRKPKEGVRYSCAKCLRKHGRTRMNTAQFELKLEYYAERRSENH